MSKPYFPLSDDELRDLCLNQKLSQNEIAKKYNVGQSSVSRHLRKIGLGGARNFNDRSGENNPNWQGVALTPCENCGKPIGTSLSERGKGEHNYCSKKCYGEHARKKHAVTKKCVICGKSFNVILHESEDRRFCSVQCAALDPNEKERKSKVHKGKIIPEWHRQAVSKAQSERAAELEFTYGKNGHHDSPKAGNIFYRSSYEKIAYQILDKDSSVICYQPEPFVIEYINQDGHTRRYRPDILVDKEGKRVLIEIKPAWKLNDDKTIRKIDAGRKFAEKKGWCFEIWTEKELGI